MAAASLVLTLTRTAGAGAGGNTFNDTPPWIADHANWLATNNIATGYPDGSFRPDDDITRGQSAFWLGNYNDAIEVVRTDEDYPGSASAFGTSTFCPVGKRPISAGHSRASAPWTLHASYPDESSPRQWVTSWSAPTSLPMPAVTVWVVCIPETIS